MDAWAIFFLKLAALVAIAALTVGALVAFATWTWGGLVGGVVLSIVALLSCALFCAFAGELNSN